jgi:2-oxo-4-hydroxy-4-carboxy-5-ureidoimidazoline decarboxylase
VIVLTLDEINALDQDHFMARLGGLFEGPPWIITAAWNHRPFDSVHALYEVLCSIMYAAPLERRIALIQSHPDLAGKAALSGTLGAASTAEQAAAGLNRLSPDELALFNRRNAAYLERFSFPFVICARRSTKDEILQSFAVRLEHSREEEVQIALEEIAKICALRLDDLCGTHYTDGRPD